MKQISIFTQMENIPWNYEWWYKIQFRFFNSLVNKRTYWKFCDVHVKKGNPFRHFSCLYHPYFDFFYASLFLFNILLSFSGSVSDYFEFNYFQCNHFSMISKLNDAIKQKKSICPMLHNEYIIIYIGSFLYSFLITRK